MGDGVTATPLFHLEDFIPLPTQSSSDSTGPIYTVTP